MNRLYEIFLQRNPTFHGQISVIGHSLGNELVRMLINMDRHCCKHCSYVLGSVILYDILVNQMSTTDNEQGKSIDKYIIEHIFF
jgi:hypothetical protein